LLEKAFPLSAGCAEALRTMLPPVHGPPGNLRNFWRNFALTTHGKVDRGTLAR